MPRSFFSVIVLACLALFEAGCIFLTRFDDGTQKCDDLAPAGQQCLPAYKCVDGLCISVDAGVTSSGDGGR